MHSEDILLLIFLIFSAVVVIVAMALNHHRKLAEIAARNRTLDDHSAAGLQALQTLVDQLRNQLHAQMIQIDTLVGNQAKMLESPPKEKQIQSRLGGDEPKEV